MKTPHWPIISEQTALSLYAEWQSAATGYFTGPESMSAVIDWRDGIKRRLAVLKGVLAQVWYIKYLAWLSQLGIWLCFRTTRTWLKIMSPRWRAREAPKGIHTDAGKSHSEIQQTPDEVMAQQSNHGCWFHPAVEGCGLDAYLAEVHSL